MTYVYQGELDCALRAAATAGAMLRQAFLSGEQEIDHRAEEEIRQTLTAGFPQYGYHGEELGFVSPGVLGVVYAYCAPDDAGDLFAWAEGTGPVKRNGIEITGTAHGVPETILVSHHADQNAHANAMLVLPMRYRAIPSIAYRLSLVAAGEAQAGVSLNGPVGWDYAGGAGLELRVAPGFKESRAFRSLLAEASIHCERRRNAIPRAGLPAWPVSG